MNMFKKRSFPANKTFMSHFHAPGFSLESHACNTHKKNNKIINNLIKIISDVILSGIGAAVWAVILGTWITIFQVYRADWDDFADSISFIIPLGKL